MLTAPNPNADVVTLTCADPDCSRWQTAQGRHLENLLAAGPWRCPDRRSRRKR